MGVYGGPEIVNDGLVLHLDAASSRSYPGSGTTWKDLSGNGNDTVITNGSYNSNGFFQSVSEDPSNLSFYTPYSTSINNALSVTTGGWTIEEIVLIDNTIYPESSAGSNFGNKPYRTGEIGFDWGHGTMSTSSLNMTVNDGTNMVRQNISLNSAQSQYDKWVHRTFLFDRTNGEIRIYYNSVYQDTLDISNVTGSIYENKTISWGTLYGWRHDGYRSGMKIYNRILTQAEVKQNFEATRSRYGV